MRDRPGHWISLFSGGKDSAWALYRALERELAVSRLVTVHPGADSYLYHVPATDLTALAAESIGIPVLDVYPGDLDATSATDAGTQGDAELVPLEAALSALDVELDGGVRGVIAGAIESEFQTSRIEAMCDRLGADLFAPLWGADPGTLGREMIAAGFESRIVAVAAAGLDEHWLGRTLDEQALVELEALHERYGVHVLGEGGEFETIVTDGPHMEQPIRFEATTVWDGMRGHLQITDAWLA